MTPALLAIGFLGAGVALDETARQLAADVRLAMKRADLSLDYVSRVLVVPPNKLSDQLNAKAHFTYLRKFFISRELREETDFLSEFFDIFADRINRIALPRGVSVLFAKVDGTPKRMAKAELPAPRLVPVTLPLAHHGPAYRAHGRDGAGVLRGRFIATGLLALCLAVIGIGCARHTANSTSSKPYGVDVPDQCKNLDPNENWFLYWWYGCKDPAGGGGSGAS
jgi:hypothetical protein